MTPPPDRFDTEARELAIEILADCASHYADPVRYVRCLNTGEEQKYIDRAIGLATKLVLAFARRAHAAGLRECVEAMAKVIADSHLIGPAPIGPLFGAGWEAALKHIGNEIGRAAELEAEAEAQTKGGAR
jgi:hypothetical protein